MKTIAMSFYSPLKPADSTVPSGDRDISRGLMRFFEQKGFQPFIASRLVGRRFRFKGSLLNGLKTTVGLLPAVVRTVSRQPQVLFTYHNYYKAPDWLHPLVSLVTGKPYFIFEASLKPSLKVTDPFYYRFLNFSFRQARLLFTDVQKDYEVLAKYFPEKTHYVKPGIELGEKSYRKQRTAHRPLQLVSVAMLRSHKKYPSVQWLVETLSELQKEGLQFHYHHIGGGDNLEALKQLCANRLEAGSYSIHGTLEKSEMHSCLNDCDIFAYPGIGESFGMVYLEAQARGLPVIAFDNGGVSEAVKTNHSGFLCPPFNRNLYKKRIIELAENPVLLARMSNQAVDYVFDEHNQDKNYGRMLDLIQQNLRHA